MADLIPALRDGAILAVAASALIMGGLRANPRLFMRHFPDALKARLDPLSPDEIRVGRIVGVSLLGLLVLGPLVSVTLAWPPTTLGVFTHAFVVGMVANAVDWLVLDELWLGVFKPRWAIPPGATQADFTPFEHGRHARGFVTGTVICAIVAAFSTAVLTAVRALG